MRTTLLLAGLLAASPASAEVVGANANGFDIRHSYDVPAVPASVFAAFGRVGEWWLGDHTYSGSSANLVMSLQPGGCFCERFPAGGGIEHMRVTYVDPGKRVVLTGSLGPLLFEATSGVLDVQFEPAGKGTKVTVRYKAAGFATGGADKLAPIVDKVLHDQFKSFAAHAAASAKG